MRMAPIRQWQRHRLSLEKKERLCQREFRVSLIELVDILWRFEKEGDRWSPSQLINLLVDKLFQLKVFMRFIGRPAGYEDIAIRSTSESKKDNGFRRVREKDGRAKIGSCDKLHMKDLTELLPK